MEEVKNWWAYSIQEMLFRLFSFYVLYKFEILVR